VEGHVRIDKWLWAVRVYKTRSLAADACKGGKVTLNYRSVKPSHEIKIGDILQIRFGQINKTIKVTGILENRVSAKLVCNYVEDLTPLEEYKKLENQKDSFFIKRSKGTGRPTKKDRREIEGFFLES
jgi:ribosome-associated heat shock protein Hsp15